MQPTDSLVARITVNPGIMAGKPTIRGLRISVQQILKALAVGQTPAELTQEYPELEPEDFRGVLLYAAEAVAEQRVYRLGA